MPLLSNLLLFKLVVKAAFSVRLLQSKLSSLQAQAHAQQAASTSGFTWRGVTHPVRHERVRLALHSASELSAQVAAARLAGSAATGPSPAAAAAAGGDDDGSAGGLESQLALYDKLINMYSEARAAVRALIRANASGEGAAGIAGGQGQTEELTGLEKALSGKLIEETLERGQLQVAEVQRRWETLQVKLAEGKKVRDR